MPRPAASLRDNFDTFAKSRPEEIVDQENHEGTNGATSAERLFAKPTILVHLYNQWTSAEAGRENSPAGDMQWVITL